MSQENVELIEAQLNAQAHDGIDAWFKSFADDIDYRAIKDAPDYPGPIRDKGALRPFGEHWLDTFDNLKLEPTELLDAGEDRVLAVLRIGGTARQSGLETELTVPIVYAIRDGKIAEANKYWTREDALEAAGLRE